MRLSLTTWNINSVRLRINLVAKFLKAVRPDVLCLQETKCIDDAFPLKRFRRLGYEHVALNGQKGYHGVAVVSRLPFESTDIRTFCEKIDLRHISVAFGGKAQLSKPLVVHNFYVPAGGDIPDPALNPKFEHKLQFLDEMKSCEPLASARRRSSYPGRRPQCRAARERRLVAQAIAQSRVAYPDRMRETAWLRRRMADGSTSRASGFRCRKRFIRGGAIAPPIGRWPIAADGSITSGYRARLKSGVSDFRITRDARGWERPSDHVPVTVTLEVLSLRSNFDR